jgi:aminoglycoside phosphotransferase (APT) family kinase protein
MTDSIADGKTAELESHLTTELGERVTETEVLEEGLNLIVSISTAADEAAYVLRRPNKLREAEYMIPLEREWAVMRRLDSTDLNTPDPVLYCDDESILGEPFFVMTYLDGETVPLGSDLPERFRNPESRERVANRVTETLARMHSLDVEPFEDVCERLTPREQVAQATNRLDEATTVTGTDLSTLRSVGDWLRENAPSEPETTLVHGDFRPGNLLFTGSDRPEIAGVLDWESAMLGDPLTELGYLLLRWRDEGDPTPSIGELEARYSNESELDYLREVNESGLAPFTSNPGSPTRREVVARYEERTGLTFENERFYVALAAFLLGTVWADLHRDRIESGEKSDWLPHIDYVSMLAESVVSGEFEV